MSFYFLNCISSNRFILICIKGTVQRDFPPPVFSNIPRPLTNRLKYFWFWLRICRVIRILSLKNLLLGIWYPGESISLGYDTPASQSPRGMIPRWVNLPRVYHTPASHFFDTKVRILQRNFNSNRNYFNPTISGPDWFENGSKKSRWTVPLKK